MVYAGPFASGHVRHADGRSARVRAARDRRCSSRQDYLDAELLILDDGADAIGDLVPSHDRIRYVRETRKANVGVKRNRLCEIARGDVILHWDDDDWAAPWRVRYQVEQLLSAGADVCGLDRVLFYAPASNEAWEYVYPRGAAPWVYGATLCYTKAFWRRNPFQPVSVGEDSRFVWSSLHKRVLPLADQRFFVGMVHAGNTSTKRTRGSRWRPVPGGIRARAADASRCTIAGRVRTRMPVALVSAARGIGDILRITPLVRVCRRLGYDVDLLLAPDYPEVVTLLEGHADVRRVFQMPSPWRKHGAPRIDGIGQTVYDVAAFTTWSLPYRTLVRSRRMLAFDRAAWIREGDAASTRRIAAALGWLDPLPAPFAVPSARRFDLAPGTVALHPGCKPDWPWKKWHGFEELASRLPSVVIVGSNDDQENAANVLPAPHGVASARSGPLGHARARRHRGTDPSIVGVRGERFGLDAPGCGARRAHVWHLRNHEPAARGHRCAEHARDHQTAALRASLPQRRHGGGATVTATWSV